MRDGAESMMAAEGDGAVPGPVPAIAAVQLRDGRTVKKLPPELRRGQPAYLRERSWARRIVLRLQEDSQFLRSAVQAAFLLLCVWIGIEFALFMRWAQSGAAPAVERPPGAEGFLPISALISFKYWLTTGIINDVHPSGLFIFVAIVAVSALLKKAFCSWICPVGTISESLWLFGQKLFGRSLSVPRWLDYPLRSLKYLLLAFFAYAVIAMGPSDLKAFIYSPYNKMADVKMYLFFANISAFAFWTIAALVVLSIVIKNFWCRYLCPYGALLGAVGWLSPFKVTRKASTCIDCSLCTKACPASIKVHAATRVWSDECMNCYACVAACPVKDTLTVQASRRSSAVPAWVFGALVVGIFTGITGLAMLTGHWRNTMSGEEYRTRMEHLDSPLYQHNRGQVPAYGPHD
jgi:polyferredoxin